MSATEDEEENELSSQESSFLDPASSPPEPDPPFDDSDFDSVDTVLSYCSSTDDYATFSDLSSDADQQEVPRLISETALNRLFKFPVKNYARKSRHSQKKPPRWAADTFSEEEDAAGPVASTSAAASRKERPINGSRSPDDGDDHDESYTCADCQHSASPLWLGCNRDCYKKRGRQGEKKLAPFLDYLEASRGLNVE